MDDMPSSSKNNGMIVTPAAITAQTPVIAAAIITDVVARLGDLSDVIVFFMNLLALAKSVPAARTQAHRMGLAGRAAPRTPLSRWIGAGVRRASSLH